MEQNDKISLALALSQVISLSEFIGSLGASTNAESMVALEHFTRDRVEHMAKIRALLDL